jgi:hypothetical protein
MAFAGSLFAAIWWVYQAFLVFWNVALLKAQDISSHDWLEIPVLIIGAAYSIGATFALTFAPDPSVSGGVITGFPFCGFTPYIVCRVLSNLC